MKNNFLINNYVKIKAQTWLTKEYDKKTREEVQALLQNEDPTNLIEAFYKDLEFGTGGLRGIMGIGTNRINVYTIGKATQGLSNFLKKKFNYLSQINVVIGYDSRNNSRLFAEQSANIFSANGINVYFFQNLRPTPQISYVVRKLECQSGICITASHNSKEYNGYKIYLEDGGQVIPPNDENIIKEINKIRSIKDIQFQKNPILIQFLDHTIDEQYIHDLLQISLNKKAIIKHNYLKIVYTPIHGTGSTLIPKALSILGFKNIFLIPEQEVISGDFPTVISPNPEELSALSLAIEKAKAVDADLVMASDPDADRIGAAVKNENGLFVLLSGNQNLLLFVYYLISQWKIQGKLTGNEYIVKTIVSTETIKNITNENNIWLYDVYTGFKWIANIMKQNEGKKTFICGGEESYGFLAEDFVRDKDAVSACMLLAEIAAWAKEQGKTIYELLQDIYIKYGFSKEISFSITKQGKSGLEEINEMMSNYRNHPPTILGNSKIILIKDFELLQEIHLINGGKTFSHINMPIHSNVLQYFTEDKTKISIRPSGTEPKIKFYIEIYNKICSRKEISKAEALSIKKIELIRQSLGIIERESIIIN